MRFAFRTWHDQGHMTRVRSFVAASIREVITVPAFLSPTTQTLPQPVMRPCVPTTLGASVVDSDTPKTYGGAAQGRLAGCQRLVRKLCDNWPVP